MNSNFNSMTNSTINPINNFINLDNNVNPQRYKSFPEEEEKNKHNMSTHPSEKKDDNQISRHIFAIDSRQRDYSVFPDPSSYNISVPEKYKNVTSIELKAAMLPRSEYNVNSTNKYLDILVGDYITNVEISNLSPNFNYKNTIFTNKNKILSQGTYKLEIDSPLFTPSIKADIEVVIDFYGKLEKITIINSGAGYSSSKPPTVKLFDIYFTVTVGKQYYPTLREGQYTIGGNPQYTFIDSSNPANNDAFQSWVPTNLMAEVENSMSYEILKNAENINFTNNADLTKYCYGRKPWTSSQMSSYANINATKDYPLLFSARIMSQYPNIDTYVNSNRDNPDNYETNSCNFNRVYANNSLIVRVNDLNFVSGGPTVSDFLSGNITFTDKNGYTYKVIAYDTINGQENDNDYILHLSLENSHDANILSPNEYWPGISGGVYLIQDFEYTLDLYNAHWELLFATGYNQILNSASLFGYEKTNYYNPKNINTIQVSHITDKITTLMPAGKTYSSENDWYLFGDPEYVILSFRPKSGTSSFDNLNERVDSNQESNINRVFACLIFDTVSPSVLQDISSGRSISGFNTIGYNNLRSDTFINYDNENNETKQLTGNVGNQNAIFFRPPGQLRAMKGADFDRKIVEFQQPVAQVYELSIRFSKFTKNSNSQTDLELYDFHGKEHLLLFEITCADPKTGRRF
jgi:hypothetical protein